MSSLISYKLSATDNMGLTLKKRERNLNKSLVNEKKKKKEKKENEIVKI